MIVYASDYGSTRDIIAYMTYLLNKYDLIVDNLDLSYRYTPVVSLDKYDIILIGSNIKFNRWNKKVLQFLEYHQKYISNYFDRFNLFVVCGKAIDHQKINKAQKKYIDEVLDKLELPSLNSAIFSGQIDLSMHSKLNWFERQYIRFRVIFSSNSSIDLRGNNDFRNWDRIAEFIYDLPVPVSERRFLSAYR